jgi:hypothetical protein
VDTRSVRVDHGRWLWLCSDPAPSLSLPSCALCSGFVNLGAVSVPRHRRRWWRGELQDGIALSLTGAFFAQLGVVEEEGSGMSDTQSCDSITHRRAPVIAHEYRDTDGVVVL